MKSFIQQPTTYSLPVLMTFFSSSFSFSSDRGFLVQRRRMLTAENILVESVLQKRTNAPDCIALSASRKVRAQFLHKSRVQSLYTSPGNETTDN